LAGFGVSAAHANFTLDLTLDNAGAAGGTSTTVSTGTVVNLDVWGTVTGGGANDGIQYAFFGVQNGGTSGDLSVVTLSGNYAGVATDAGSPVTTSQSGTLYGSAGSKSVGSATSDSTVADGPPRDPPVHGLRLGDRREHRDPDHHPPRHPQRVRQPRPLAGSRRLEGHHQRHLRRRVRRHHHHRLGPDVPGW
jgi:hypothetical protein